MAGIVECNFSYFKKMVDPGGGDREREREKKIEKFGEETLGK